MRYRELESNDNEIIVQFSIGPEDAHKVYGHLHHTDFGKCYDICRCFLQEEWGVSDEDLAGRGMKLVVRDYHLEIEREVLPGDEVEVHSSFLYGRDAKVFIKHKMYRG